MALLAAVVFDGQKQLMSWFYQALVMKAWSIYNQNFCIPLNYGLHNMKVQRKNKVIQICHKTK